MKQIVNYTMLYYLGDHCDEITGGWEARNIFYSSSTTQFSPTFGSNYIEFNMTAVRQTASINTKNKLAGLDQYVGIGVIFEGTANKSAYCRAFILSLNPTLSNYPSYEASIYKPSYAPILDADYNPLPSGKALRNASVNDFSSRNNRQLSLWGFIGPTDPIVKSKIYTCYLYKSDIISPLSTYGSTITEIIANASALLNDVQAVNYMIHNCTGDFMVSALAKTMFINAYKASPYKSMIDANEHWSKFSTLI